MMYSDPDHEDTFGPDCTLQNYGCYVAESWS